MWAGPAVLAVPAVPAALVALAALVAPGGGWAVPAIQDRPAPPGGAAEALARVDSLLGAGAAAAAAEVALVAESRWRDDALYGWQAQGRAGAALVAADRPAEALPRLEAALRRQPADASLHHQLGLALAALGRRGRALAEFEQAAAADPSATAPRLEAGRLRAAMGDWRGARDLLLAARAACAGCPEAERLLASVLLQAGQAAEAVPPLRRLLAVEPTPEVRRHLLAALAAAGDDTAVLALVGGQEPAAWTADDWRMAVQAEGNLRQAHWSAAAAGAATGSRSPGLPGDDDAFWARAALNLLQAGRPLEALVAVDRAVALAPGRALHHHNRAAILAALDRTEDARLALQAADAAPDQAGRKQAQ